MKCTVCQHKIQKNWTYCPGCGNCLFSPKKEEVYTQDRLPYVLGRYKHGNFLFKNFSSLDNLSRTPWMKVEKIRPTLGNFAHSLLLDLSIFSFLYHSPKSITDVYNIGQFVGYSSAGGALSITKLDKPISILSGTGLFWKLFEFERLWKEYAVGWEKVGSGIVKRESINKKTHSMEMSIRNCSTSAVSSEKPLCFWYAGVLSGQMECLFPGYWIVSEKKCSCQKKEEKCLFKLNLLKKEKNPKLPKLTKDEVEGVLDQIIQKCIKKKKNIKGEVGDYQHIMMHQATNFPLNSSSAGHRILLKQSGNFIGKDMIIKSSINEVRETLKLLKEQFTYLKAGIIDHKEENNKITIKMKESVYSSGVNNIGMKLDTFLAGIIEGALCKATKEKWLVEETKCLANGNDYCEFECKKQK